ncbi:MAG: hypothetical protein JW708_02285, partial [Vallitaleaceae bacterium]|nr:hypothetical protein [Vallitaleaceae bacterium]
MKEKRSTKRLRAIIMILLLSLVFVQLSDFDSLSIEAEEHGFWRLIKIQVDETEYFNPAPSDYRLRSIEFEEGPSVDLNLGEMSVINVEFTEEADGTKGKYQTFFKWTHPQTTLRAGEEYSILLVAKQEVNTTDLMLGNSIICSHQLLAPPDVYQTPIAAIQGASLTLMNKEFGDSGLNTEKNFEFRVREPDQKKEYGYIFRVEVKSNNAYRRYDYIYEWVDEVYPILQEIRVFINGQLLVTEVPAVIQEGRTLVPLRAILEALGAQL